MTAPAALDLVCEPKSKRAPGQRRGEPQVYPQIGKDQAARLAQLAKALGDPVRVQLVDVLRRHAGRVCVCELAPLFDIGQPALSHHLKTLKDAGILGVERHGLWAYYYVVPGALEELSGWLSG